MFFFILNSTHVYIFFKQILTLKSPVTKSPVTKSNNLKQNNNNKKIIQFAMMRTLIAQFVSRQP